MAEGRGGGNTWVLRDQGEGHGEAGMQGGHSGTQAEGQCAVGRGRGRTRRCAVYARLSLARRVTVSATVG